ncbi:C-GCAxxG-C-C family (seleno)protein [Candidatus Electronema sp. PJ]|uniref:C-GCAxxG-C-C family (seleno)protein n=1 Tax=Candidatus Electronema sp. PJ TaxID=3401572 RepID=UPI003AA9636C
MEEKLVKEIEQEGVSRRQVLAGTGALAAGAILSHVGGLISPAVAKDGTTEQWPWPYEKLDPEKTAQLAYEEWYRVFCGAAVISSIFSQLREKVGGPYNSFPIDSFIYLEGGQAGWGTICGAPAGANMVFNLIIGPRKPLTDNTTAHEMCIDIMEWYSKANMPIYMPKNPKVTAELPHTVSNSPLCHLSVGRWMKAANKPLASPERKDRCARVAASTAYRAVELLNDWKDGKYKATGEFNCGKIHGITGQQNCNDCHGANIPEAPKAPPEAPKAPEAPKKA